MRPLRVTLVQQPLHWEDAQANRERFAVRLAPLAGTTDLVVLPEMFTTGFSMAPERLAESDDGATHEWLRSQARALDAAVTGSLIVRAGAGHYNRLLFMKPDGTAERYDKRHLFRMAHEHERYAAGEQPLLVEWRGWRICPLVCYDLRFPVWSRRRPGLDYELLVYVANWPAARRGAWRALLPARAIENLSCVVAVNRIGADGQGIEYVGDSGAWNHLGEPLADLGSREAAHTVTLDGEALRAFRERFPAHLDSDRFAIEP